MTAAAARRHTVSERGAKSASTRIGLPLAAAATPALARVEVRSVLRQGQGAKAFAPKAGPAGYCRPCVAAYVRDWRRARRRW